MMTKKNDSTGMRILYVSGKAGFFGGVERYIYDTAEVLAEAGWKISMMFGEKAFVPDKFLKIFDKKFEYSGIDALIADEDFDFVVIFKVDDPGLVAKLRLAFNTCVCVSDHDYYCLRRHKYFPIGRINCSLPSNLLYCYICTLGRGKPFRYASLLNEIRKCDGFIVLSDFMRDNLVMNNFDPDNVYKVYPVCKLPGKLKRRCGYASPPRIMYAGQLIRGKGVDLLLRAAAGIKHSFKLLIVGDGNDRQYLEKMTEKLGINDKVEFTGWRNDMTKFWNRADIAVFPSRWQEPFGLTGIEAMAHKVPVVGFAVGGVGEWLHNEENGLDVPPENVNTLREELEYLLDNPEKAMEMGEAGYRFVSKNFSGVKFVSAVGKVIKSIRKNKKTKVGDV
jgi:glycosyltransferase involved in cell wall biosynthesis